MINIRIAGLAILAILFGVTIGTLTACGTKAADEVGSMVQRPSEGPEQLGTVNQALSDPDASTPTPPAATPAPTSSTPIAPPTPLLDAPDSEYLAVPGGRRIHRSCVRVLNPPSGTVVDAISRVTTMPNGQQIPPAPPCAYREHTAPQNPDPISVSNHYELYSGSEANGCTSDNGCSWGSPSVQCGNSGYPFWRPYYCYPWFNQIYGVIQVPSAPPAAQANDGQFVDIWNGLVAYGGLPPGHDVLPILQPVLSWGYNGIAGWWIFFWYIDSYSGDSPFIFGASPVSPGQYLRLNLWVRDQNCTASSGNYCDWAMRAWINGTGIDYTYYFNSVPGIFNVAWRAVLETYTPYDTETPPQSFPECNCNELPQNGVANWTNTFIWQPLNSATDFHQVNPVGNQWYEGWNSPRLTYGCTYNWNNDTSYTVNQNWVVQ